MHFDTHEPMKWCFLNSKLKLDVTDERVIQYIPGCKQSLSSPLQIYVRIQDFLWGGRVKTVVQEDT